MAKQIMVDIETFSLANNAIFPTLGAVRFDNNEIYDRFEVGIDPVDAEKHGLKLDAATVMYWLDPKRDEARKIMFEMPKIDLHSALMGFAAWVNETPEAERGSLWGKGATFDNVRIKSAYDAIGEKYPFTYREDECYRTLANRCPEVEYVQHGVAHVGVDDALSQAIHLQAICAKYGIAL